MQTGRIRHKSSAHRRSSTLQCALSLTTLLTLFWTSPNAAAQSNDSVPFEIAAQRREFQGSVSNPAFHKGEKVHGEFLLECRENFVLIGRHGAEQMDFFELPQFEEARKVWTPHLGSVLPLTVQILRAGKRTSGTWGVPFLYPVRIVSWGHPFNLVNPTKAELDSMEPHTQFVLKGIVGYRNIPYIPFIQIDPSNRFNLDESLPRFARLLDGPNSTPLEEHSPLATDEIILRVEKGPEGQIRVPKGSKPYLISPGTERTSTRALIQLDIRDRLTWLQTSIHEGKFEEARKVFAALEGRRPLMDEQSDARKEELRQSLPPEQRPLSGLDLDVAKRVQAFYGRNPLEMTRAQWDHFADAFESNTLARPDDRSNAIYDAPFFEALFDAGYGMERLRRIAKNSLPKRIKVLMEPSQTVHQHDFSRLARPHMEAISAVQTLLQFPSSDAVDFLMHFLPKELPSGTTLYGADDLRFEILDGMLELLQNSSRRTTDAFLPQIQNYAPLLRQLKSDLLENEPNGSGSIWAAERLLAHLELREPDPELEPGI
jgi:hypothetical protein